MSIQLEKNFSSFPRQYFALRKILKQLIGELFPKGKEQRDSRRAASRYLAPCLPSPASGHSESQTSQ